MKIVLERLEREGVEVDENFRAEITALWHWGIEKISDPELKASLIEYYRSVVPWQFFVGPSSAKGKHHPPHHNRRGGIVRHLTECCVLAPRLLHMYGFSQKNDKEQRIDQDAFDIVLAATLITDTFKNGNPWKDRTVPNHGEIAADAWLPCATNCRVLNAKVSTVYHAVYWHYGRYTPAQKSNELLALPVLTQIVHLLDAISSADEIKVLYIPVPKIDVPENKKPSA